MRIVALLVGVVAVVFLVVLVTFAAGLASRRRADRVAVRAAAAARWRLRHYAQHGETVVSVALMPPDGHVIEEHVVDRFPDADPDWEQRFLAAREEAERRAFHLNADRPELGD